MDGNRSNKICSNDHSLRVRVRRHLPLQRQLPLTAPLLQQVLQLRQHPLTCRQQLGRPRRRQPPLSARAAHQTVQLRQGCPDPEAQGGGQPGQPLLEL
ncbi:MAG: hypothetical protein ACJ0GQ_08835 [Parasynechococcus sp.]